MVSTCVNITYIYTLGADVSEITERGTLVGQGNKVQCTHPFTVASLSRFLSYPPTANVSLSVTFPSFFVYRYRLFFPFSRTGTATAVASDSVSNGSGGHTILRLNSTDTAAQLRSFSSYSFFFLFLSLSFCSVTTLSFFSLSFRPHTFTLSLSSTLSLSLCPMLLLSPLFSFSLHFTRYVRYPARYATTGVSCSIENILGTHTHIMGYIVRPVSSLAIEKSDYERPLIFYRGNVLRVVGKSTKEMAKLSVVAMKDTVFIRRRRDSQIRTSNKDDMKTTFQLLRKILLNSFFLFITTLCT